MSNGEAIVAERALENSLARTYVLADLHGRFDLLCRAIEVIEDDAGQAGGTLVVLGDFIDRGPDSSKIIDVLIAGPRRPNWKWIVLQGNHEAMMLEALSDPTKLRWWFGNGGRKTLKSYGHEDPEQLQPLKIPPEHLQWLAGLPVTHEDEYRIYVHAGVPADQQVAETPVKTLQWMRYRRKGKDVGAEAAHISGKHIVHGHDQAAHHPLLNTHRTNLDSFAWRTGRAAIGVFEDSPGGPVKVLEAVGAPVPIFKRPLFILGSCLTVVVLLLMLIGIAIQRAVS